MVTCVGVANTLPRRYQPGSQSLPPLAKHRKPRGNTERGIHAQFKIKCLGMSRTNNQQPRERAQESPSPWYRPRTSFGSLSSKVLTTDNSITTPTKSGCTPLTPSNRPALDFGPSLQPDCVPYSGPPFVATAARDDLWHNRKQGAASVPSPRLAPHGSGVGSHACMDLRFQSCGDRTDTEPDPRRKRPP